MTDLFLRLFNMSINAGWLVLAVLVLRIILKKAPKFIRLIMWGLVGIRLAVPISIESVLSLLPSGEVVSPEIVYEMAPTIHTGVELINSAVNPIISDSLAATPENSINPIQIVLFIAANIWVVGIAAMIIYAVISYIKIKLRVRESILLKENIYICDNIPTPFILGIIKPKIYLPSALSEEDAGYVIAHEKAHLSRLDNLWKPLGFLLLTAYWFNPLMWVAFILLCRDIELATDEKVINNSAEDIKKPYSEALINCSVEKRLLSACPLAFGETGVKGRIKSVLNYKKPAFWIIIASVIALIVTAVCFLTNPKDKVEAGNLGITGSVSAAECEDVEFKFSKGNVDKHNPYIEVEWVNNTDDALCYGEEFKLFYEDEEIPLAEDYVWNLPLYTVNSGGTSTQKLSLSGFDVSRSGNYRLEKEFFLDSESDKKYKAYVEFVVDRRFSFIGLQYKGEKIVFEDGMYSSIFFTDESIPQYCISDDMHLYTSDRPTGISSSSWYDVGELSSFKLEKETFDGIINNVAWDAGYNALILREHNKNAFRVVNQKDNRLYYLLEQENGEVYLAYGYADTYSIRWIFKLKSIGNYENSVDDNIGIYVYNESPEPITAPSLTLNYTDNTFHFSWSLFSSYLAMGDFEYERDSVICTTEDGKNTYVFHKTDYGYVFDGKRSSEIPSYKYSADAKTAECPVPDGAKFKSAAEDKNTVEKGGNPYFNATVLEVKESSVLVEPFSDSDEYKSCDKIYISLDVVSTNPVPKLQKGDEIRIVYNGEISEAYPASIHHVFAIYSLDELENYTEPTVSGSSSAQNSESQSSSAENDDTQSAVTDSGEPITDRAVKQVYILKKNTNTTNKFFISRTIEGNDAKKLGEYLNTAHLEAKTEGNWVKFNPARPNEFAIAITLDNNATIMLNIHFSIENSTRYYVAIGKSEQGFNIENSFEDLNYQRYIASDEFGKFLKDLIG